MTDITNLYYQNPELDGSSKLLLNSNKIGVLLIHGFTATTVEVQKLFEYFKAQGFSVSAPLLPGHGTTPGELNKIKYQDWIIAVENAFHKLSGHCENILVGGESMGAVMAMLLAQKHKDVSGLMLFSPALLVDRLRYAKWIKPFVKYLDKNQPEDDLPWQGYTVYPTAATAEFYKLTRRVKKDLARISSPTIIFQGKHDRSINPENAEFIYSRISSQIKEKVYLDHSGHVILLDQEIKLIMTKLFSFFDSSETLRKFRGL